MGIILLVAVAIFNYNDISAIATFTFKTAKQWAWHPNC
jgi:hypothetical protein